MPLPEISFIILSYNSARDLPRCLQSIAKHVRQSYEIIVVDNASADDSAELVRREFPSVRLFASDRNMLAAGWNYGIRKASGRLVAIVNPDTALLEGTFDRMYAYLETHGDVAAVSPRLQNDDGSVESCFWRERTFRFFLYTCTFLRHLFPGRTARLEALHSMSDRSRTEVMEVEMMIDVCMLVRRDALDQVGLYDDQFKLYFSDDDICLRLRQAGWKLVFLGDVVTRHARHQSVNQHPPAWIVSIWREDALRYCRKHFGAVSATLLLPFLRATMLLRALRVRFSSAS